MKIIVDTCVWSLSLRRRDQTRMSANEQRMLAELKEAIQIGARRSSAQSAKR
jgi:hypothetical protein